MNMKDFLDCPNEECDSKVRWDRDDRQYSCGSCNTILVIVPLSGAATVAGEDLTGNEHFAEGSDQLHCHRKEG